MEEQKQFVSNASKAYDYNYASLGDIALQGFTIPRMRIKPTEFGQFIEYKDSDGEWQIGAQIVVPTMKRNSNEAQAYGSALTYARRYTTLMALGLVCDDDKKLEKAEQVQETHENTTKAKTAPQNAPQSATAMFHDFIRKNDSKRNDIHAWCKEKFGNDYTLTEEIAAAVLAEFAK